MSLSQVLVKSGVTTKIWHHSIGSAHVRLLKHPYSCDTNGKKLIILGTGWGSYSILKTIDKKKYDVSLPHCTIVGTLEFRSIIEPVSNTGFRQTDHFHLSHATDIDPVSQTIQCQSVLCQKHQYQLAYDKLIIGVRALSNTFGGPGMKEVADARAIQNCLLSNFELALQPGIRAEERQSLLHIIIVGGGPTGVEFGAELYDFVEQDVSRLYKKEEKDVRVTLVESNQILASFDDRLRAFAEKIKQ